MLRTWPPSGLPSELASFQSIQTKKPTPTPYLVITDVFTKMPSPSPSPVPSAAPSSASPSEAPSLSPTILSLATPVPSVDSGGGGSVDTVPIGLGGASVLTYDPTSVGVLTLQPTDAPRELGAVVNAQAQMVYDLAIEQVVQSVAVEPARRATFVGRVPFTPIPGSYATKFYYSKNSLVSMKARVEESATVDTNSTLSLPARRRLLNLSSALGTVAPVMKHAKGEGVEWQVQLNLQNASFQNSSFHLLEFAATDAKPLSPAAQAVVLFRKRPGYPDIFCISESDRANASFVRLGAARGHACATFSQYTKPAGRAGHGEADGLSFRSFGISPFAFRKEDAPIIGVHELCQKDRAPQMAQVFALGCNVTTNGDVICDMKNPSRFLLLRVSCDGLVETLRVKDDTVILSPVACVVEGRLEPSDLFCRDPTSAHQLLGPLSISVSSCFPNDFVLRFVLRFAGMLSGTLSRELPNCTAELLAVEVPCTNITLDDPRLLLEGTPSGAWANWKCIMDQYGTDCMKQMPEEGSIATMHGLTPCNDQDRSAGHHATAASSHRMSASPIGRWKAFAIRRFVIRPVGCMDSAEDCKATVLSDELIEFQFRLPSGVKPAQCWPGPSLLSKILGYAILWVVLAALSARFGIHFAALFRRKQAKKKLQASVLQHTLAKGLAGGQSEAASASSDDDSCPPSSAATADR